MHKCAKTCAVQSQEYDAIVWGILFLNHGSSNLYFPYLLPISWPVQTLRRKWTLNSYFSELLGESLPKELRCLVNKRHSCHQSQKIRSLNCHFLPVQGLSMWRGKQNKDALQGPLQEKNPCNCDSGPQLVNDPFMMFGLRLHLTTLVPAILDLELSQGKFAGLWGTWFIMCILLTFPLPFICFINFPNKGWDRTSCSKDTWHLEKSVLPSQLENKKALTTAWSHKKIICFMEFFSFILPLIQIALAQIIQTWVCIVQMRQRHILPRLFFKRKSEQFYTHILLRERKSILQLFQENPFFFLQQTHWICSLQLDFS